MTSQLTTNSLQYQHPLSVPNPQQLQNPFKFFTQSEYALWPRDSQELYDEAREKYINSLEEKHEVLQFIESELDKEEPLLLPKPYTPPELDQLHSNYKDTISEIASCTQQFCPNLTNLYDRSIRLAMEIDSPEHMYKYRKCRFDRILQLKNPSTCAEPLNEVIEQLMPRILKSIEKETVLLSGERLENYIGLDYKAPFWFEGAGDVWRRLQHGSNLVNRSSPCDQIKQSMEQCLADKHKTEDDCYWSFTQNSICAPGLNCRYLRVPMTNCLAANPFANYQGITQCLHMLPNYEQCQTQHVPKPKSIHVEVTDIIEPYEMKQYNISMKDFFLNSRREKHDASMKQFANRAKEILEHEDDDWSMVELGFLFKFKHLSYDECMRRLKELNIADEIPNPYDKYMFSEDVQLQPQLVNPQRQSEWFDEQLKLFEKFSADVAETKEGYADRVEEQLQLLNWIREETKRRQRPTSEYPDIKHVIYFDHYWKTYFSYQPILNTSYPIFPISHLYHYQDFDYDWVDPQGTVSSVPFIRIDSVGENYSPSFFARHLIKTYPKERLLACRNNLDCDKSNKELGTYLGYPQLDDMNFLNHYRMYFKPRDMYLTCYANDTTCIPSRFPDDNYGTFRDSRNNRNWFYRPDRFEYYCYNEDGDRLVFNIADKNVLLWKMNGVVEQVAQDIADEVIDVMKNQSGVWELEAIDIVKHRSRKENILKTHVSHGGSLLQDHLQNTQFDERIPYTFHPFATYSDNLDAYRYYLGLKNKEKYENDLTLATDPAQEVRDRIKYRYRNSIDFFNPITTMEDDDANRMRDALILSYHELKLLRHPLGGIIMREMPPRVADRYDPTKDQRPALYNYLNVLKLDPTAALMFDTAEDSPLVINYMKRHNLTSFEQYQEVLLYAQEFQEELIEEYQMLEVNEMGKYQQFIADRSAQAASLKLTYTEKLVRLFKLYEKYGKVAPNLELFCAAFGWSPDGVHHAEQSLYKPRIVPDPADFFTFGV